jgi:hypothetical protein
MTVLFPFGMAGSGGKKLGTPVTVEGSVALVAADALTGGGGAPGPRSPSTLAKIQGVAKVLNRTGMRKRRIVTLDTEN